MNIAPRMADGEHDSCSQEAVFCEGIENPQPVKFTQNTVEERQTKSTFQINNKLSEFEEAVSGDTTCHSEDMKSEGTSAKQSNSVGNVYAGHDLPSQLKIIGFDDTVDSSKETCHISQGPSVHTDLEDCSQYRETNPVDRNQELLDCKQKCDTSIEVNCSKKILHVPLEFSPAPFAGPSDLCASINSEASGIKFGPLFTESVSDTSDLKSYGHYPKQMKVTTVNEICDTAPPRQSEDDYDHVVSGLVYVETSFPGAGIDVDDFNDFFQGCGCDSICSASCLCIRQHGRPYVGGKLVAYHETQPIFECNDGCNCGIACPNRLVQGGPITGLKISQISNKGYGVTTTQFIPKHAFVCEYAGEWISVEEAQKRFSKQRHEESNYVLVMREYTSGRWAKPQITVVDPTVVGNIGRYINHSCDPNLVVVPVRINNMIPIAALFAVRDIIPGEELCYNYNSTQDNLSPSPSQDLGGSIGTCCRGGSKDVVNIKEENEKGTGLEMSPTISQDVSFRCKDSETPSTSQIVLKPCFCKAKNCRGFLPVTDVLCE